MWTTAHIKRHIFSLPVSKPFTTRDCLVYGVRSAVDQALYRLVKNGTIRRLARGIFVRDEKKYFSVFEVAKLRAEAFGRKIMRHDFVIPTEMDWNKTTIEPKLFINSRSTRIRIDGQVIKLHGLSPRKMRLNATKAGQALKALWKLGKENVNREVIMHATYRFNRIDRQDVKDYVRWLPAWLTSYFIRTQWPYADKYQDSVAENTGPKILVRLL
jgi:Family of unknown function (DUF6088)